jgi:hypothetical protein
MKHRAVLPPYAKRGEVAAKPTEGPRGRAEDIAATLVDVNQEA